MSAPSRCSSRTIRSAARAGSRRSSPAGRTQRPARGGRRSRMVRPLRRGRSAAASAPRAQLGLTIETDQQNTLLELEDGWPVRGVLRETHGSPQAAAHDDIARDRTGHRRGTVPRQRAERHQRARRRRARRGDRPARRPQGAARARARAPAGTAPSCSTGCSKIAPGPAGRTCARACTTTSTATCRSQPAARRPRLTRGGASARAPRRARRGRDLTVPAVQRGGVQRREGRRDEGMASAGGSRRRHRGWGRAGDRSQDEVLERFGEELGASVTTSPRAMRARMASWSRVIETRFGSKPRRGTRRRSARRSRRPSSRRR